MRYIFSYSLPSNIIQYNLRTIVGPIGGPMKLTAKFVENVTEAGKYYDLHGLFLHVHTVHTVHTLF